MTIHYSKSIKTSATSIDDAIDIILQKGKMRMTWADNVHGEAKLKQLRTLERGRTNARGKRKIWNPATCQNDGKM